MAKKILVVDDDAMNLKMAEMILKSMPYEVVTVSSGQECLDYLLGQPVELVLLDVLMPEMDGLETLRKLRDMEQGKNLPVMLLSASMEDDVREEAEELGAMDYIQKPFLPQNLQERVKMVLG